MTLLSQLATWAEQAPASRFDRLVSHTLTSRFADQHHLALHPLMWLLLRDQKDGLLSSTIDQLASTLASTLHPGADATDQRGDAAQLSLLLDANPRVFHPAETAEDQGTSPFVVYRNRIYPRKHWQQRQKFSTLIHQRLQPVLPAENERWGLTEPTPEANDAEEVDALLTTFARHRLVLLIGGPGSGKTTTLVKFLRRLLQQAGPWAEQLRIALAGPTGRAAGRMVESIAYARTQNPHRIDPLLPQQSTTIHRLLGLRYGRPWHHQHSPLSYDLVVIDEASMIDLRMFNQLLSALPQQSRLLLIGDADQLPPIDPGPVLKRLLTMPQLAHATVKLAGSRRSVAPIQQVARAIKEARREDLRALFDPQGRHAAPEQAVVCRPLPNFFGYCRYLERQYRNSVQHVLPPPQTEELSLSPAGWAELLQPARHLLDALTVLSPTRRGPWGVETLNRQLDFAFGGRQHNYHGRWIVITRNDHRNGLANGERGLILSFAARLYAFFPSMEQGWRHFPLEQLQNYEAAWVQTIHRSQGSEFDQVEILLPLTEGVNTELIYTAVTRARKRLRLYAQPDSLDRWNE